MIEISGPVKLLCTGDLHLGRHPAGIPDSLDGKEFSPGKIWEGLVEKAIDYPVDLVIVAGDIIDRKNRYFETYGDFESGVRKLTEAGIPLYLVSGNHDFDAVPDLLDGLSDKNIKQLGRNGEWESVRLELGEGSAIRIAGWSYPNRHVKYTPLDRLKDRYEDNIPTVGVLHGDLGSSDSRYAPISETDLQRAGVDTWIIGHLHNPNLRSRLSPFVLIPGSPQPLDRTESGLHGPWILTVGNDGSVGAEQFPLANLRYEKVTIDVSNMERIEEIPPAFYSRVEQTVGESRNVKTKLLAIDLELKGRTSIYDDLKTKFRELAKDLRRESGDTSIAITSLANKTRPAIDLEEIARGSNLPAVLAELILKLEKGGGEDFPDDLLERTSDSLTDAYYSNAYRALRQQGEVDPPDRDLSLKFLKEQSWVILDSLLSQTNHER